MINQHIFKQWSGDAMNHAITWANVEPYLSNNIVSLDHNELHAHNATWMLCNVNPFTWFITCFADDMAHG